MTERRAGPARVLGTFLTLLLLLLALGWFAKGLMVSAVDGSALQREYFGGASPPFGLVLESAVRLPTGDTLVRFTRAGEGGVGPREALFLQYRSAAAVPGLFRPTALEGGVELGMRMKEWERAKDFAWHATMKRDEIAWGEWSSKLLVERSFAKGGGWSEEARVDLSSAQRPLVLFVHWPPETPVDEGELRELLRAVVITQPAG